MIAVLLSAPAAVVPLDPALAALLYSAELVALLVVFAAAVFGPTSVSERAFRLLRWMTNRPEPLTCERPSTTDQPRR